MSELENYIILSSIGEGAFGKVKRKTYAVAKHKLTDQKVAIKFIKKSIAKSLNLETNIIREVRISKKFSHPYIVKMYDVVIGENYVYIVMEYIQGGELHSCIERKGRLEESKARKYFQQLVSAVDYSHKNRVSHRDIKPENILLDKNDNVKLTDFGLSNYMKDGDFLKTCCGSSNYAAPEVILQQQYCGTEIDVWSLGVLLFTMMAGALPFDEPNLPALYAKIKKADFKMPLYFSGLSGDLIKKCLVVDPRFRITIEEMQSHPWFKQLNIYSKGKNGKNLEIDEKVFKKLLKKPEFLDLVPQKESLQQRILKRNSFSLFNTSYEILLCVEQNKKKSFSIMQPLFANTEFTYQRKTDILPHDWSYFIRTTDSSQDLMITLFTLLIDCELEWKILTKFQIRVQTKNSHNSKVKKSESNWTSGWNYVKFQITVYSIESGFALDFKLITGETLHFFDIFANLYKGLITILK